MTLGLPEIESNKKRKKIRLGWPAIEERRKRRKMRV